MIYDYKCLACGERFQKAFKIGTAKRRAKCTLCGSKKTRRITHQANFILKGSGFYSTDNRK